MDCQYRLAFWCHCELRLSWSSGCCGSLIQGSFELVDDLVLNHRGVEVIFTQLFIVMLRFLVLLFVVLLGVLEVIGVLVQARVHVEVVLSAWGTGSWWMGLLLGGLGSGLSGLRLDLDRNSMMSGRVMG